MISKELNGAEHEYMNIGPPNYRSSGAPGFISARNTHEALYVI